MAKKKKKQKTAQVTSDDLLRMWPFGVKEYEFNLEERRAHLRTVRNSDGLPKEWAFDWALPEFKIAFELDGYTYHTSRGGWLNDMAKFNAAHLQGWRVFHITPDDFRGGKADHLMQQVLQEFVNVKEDPTDT